MDTSVKLNGLVREHSSEAVLVLMNMPPPVTPFVDSMTGSHSSNILLFCFMLNTRNYFPENSLDLEL